MGTKKLREINRWKWRNNVPKIEPSQTPGPSTSPRPRVTPAPGPAPASLPMAKRRTNNQNNSSPLNDKVSTGAALGAIAGVVYCGVKFIIGLCVGVPSLAF